MIVMGDESLLKVAISNIMENGCKYSPEHTVDVHFELSAENIQLVFTDKGIGISEADMKKIFEPFYRGTNAITYAGTGIGLPLVKQIIKVHNGELKLSSVIGKGTTVIIKLPAVSDNQRMQ